MAKTDYVANLHIIVNRPDVTSMRDIRDGTQHTILFGEKAFDPIIQTVASWYWDEPLYIGGSQGTARDSTTIVEDRAGADFRENWGSSHGGLTHFAYADGHLNRITHSIDTALFLQLLTPADGDN